MKTKKYNLEIVKSMIDLNFSSEVLTTQSPIETLFISDKKTKVALIGVTENNIKYLSNNKLAKEIVEFIESIEEMFLFHNQVNTTKSKKKVI